MPHPKMPTIIGQFSATNAILCNIILTIVPIAKHDIIMLRLH